MVKVSVIIPGYNGDRYIEDAIVSVLTQTYTDYEIIAIDDGSTDNTHRVIQKYGDQVKYFSQTNQGVAVSRNLGLSKAEGEYIAFLDQDDVFLPDKLAVQVALLDSNPSLGMVNSGWQIVDRYGKIQAAVEPWKKIPQLSLADLIIWKPVFLGAMLFRRSWLQRTAGFNPNLEQTPDVDLVLRLAAIGCTAAWVKQTTVKYRQHETNASKNSLLQAKELDRILERFFTQPNLPSKVKSLEADSRYQSLVWSAWRLQQTGHLQEMCDFLAKSGNYSQKYPTEIIINWIESFKNYSAEYGTSFDVMELTSSSPWQALIQKYLF
ncbi:glycosyltransferase [Waterburya agarophytonicola K14]|uniref:Glycosyltransferase n=1 Tax=Waterburya agarophytonicola KI4 TaxID=2874699 RepID=A0A964FF21_9CYAN|nr:glycosyltransferase [Waterburya agarophytonicola]MCC0177280.1 glycosyltransferase [Waterburya agarophytonicola KI4]